MVGIEIGGDNSYVLEVRPVVSHRPKVRSHEFGCDVIRSNMIFYRTSVATLQVIGSEERHIGFQIVRLNQFERVIAALPSKHRCDNCKKDRGTAGLCGRFHRAIQSLTR